MGRGNRRASPGGFSALRGALASIAAGTGDPPAINRASRVAYEAGVVAWGQRDHQQAQGSFVRAVELDPGNADAWMGLLYYHPDDVYTTHHLYKNLERLGSLQRDSRTSLHGRTRPMRLTYVEVKNRDEAGLAHASALADGGHIEAAISVLDRHPDLDPALACALRSRLSLAAGDHHQALLQAQITAASGPLALRAEALVMQGNSLLRMEQPQPAIAPLQLALDSSYDDQLRGEAGLLLGVAHSQAGDRDRADLLLREALQNGFEDARAHLDVLDDDWLSVQRSLRSSMLADDPSIADNA